MQPPKELLEAIKEWCVDNGMGMTGIFTGDFGAIVFGKDEYGPDQVSLLVSHMLLEGIINGTWSKQNEELREKERKKVM